LDQAFIQLYKSDSEVWLCLKCLGRNLREAAFREVEFYDVIKSASGRVESTGHKVVATRMPSPPIHVSRRQQSQGK